MRFLLALLCLGGLGTPGAAQPAPKAVELSFAAALSFTADAFEATAFARGGYTLPRGWVPELELGLDRRRSVTTVVYVALLRKNLAGSGLRPFVLAGGGAESTIISPFAETRPLMNLGAGALVPLSKTAFLRAEYRFRRVFARSVAFNRHHLFMGLLFRWTR